MSVNSNIVLKIGVNTSVQLIGKVVSFVLGFATVGILTRYLGTEGYGNFTLVFAFVASFGILSDFGTYPIYVRELSKKTETKPSYIGTLFILKLILVLLSALITIIASFLFPYPPFVKLAILIGALSFSLSGTMNYSLAIFQSRVRLDLVTLVDVLAKIVTALFIVLFVCLKVGLLYIITAVLIGNLVAVVTAFILSNRLITISLQFDKDLAIKILRWSIPVGLASLFSLMPFRIDTLILSLVRNQREVGIYSLSYKILENIFVIWGFYMASVYPLLANLQSQDTRKYRKLLLGSVMIAISFSLILIPLCYILAPLIIHVLGGNDFVESIGAFRILIFSIPMFFLNNLFYFYYLVNNRTTPLLIGLGLTFFISLLLNIGFTPRYGYIASVTIVLIAQSILLVAMVGLAVPRRILT